MTTRVAKYRKHIPNHDYGRFFEVNTVEAEVIYCHSGSEEFIASKVGLFFDILPVPENSTSTLVTGHRHEALTFCKIQAFFSQD